MASIWARSPKTEVFLLFVQYFSKTFLKDFKSVFLIEGLCLLQQKQEQNGDRAGEKGRLTINSIYKVTFLHHNRLGRKIGAVTSSWEEGATSAIELSQIDCKYIDPFLAPDAPAFPHFPAPQRFILKNVNVVQWMYTKLSAIFLLVHSNNRSLIVSLFHKARV